MFPPPGMRIDVAWSDDEMAGVHHGSPTAFNGLPTTAIFSPSIRMSVAVALPMVVSIDTSVAFLMRVKGVMISGM